MKYIKYLIVAILAIMATISVCKGCMNAIAFSQDFQWDAAKALSMRIDPYEESMNPSGALDEGALGEFYARFKGIGAPQKMEANQFPSLLVLLIPYTWLSPDAARIAWMISNLIFTAAIIWLLGETFLKDMDRYVYVCLSLLMLAGTPYRNQLGVGQHTLFAFAFFLLAVYCSEKNCSAGTIIALFISYFKYTLTAPLVLYFIYKKKYKEVAISVAAHVVVTIGCALWLGDSVINMILKPLKVASVLASEGGLDLGALMGGSSVAFIVAGIVCIGLLYLTIKAPNGYGNLIFAVSLLWSMILTYHRTYDFFAIAAAGCILFASDEMPSINEKLRPYISGGYLITLLSVFFVLRVFSENAASRVVVGGIYYIFTIAVTFLLLFPDRLLGKETFAQNK